MLVKSILAVAALATAAVAQQTVPTYGSSLNMTIDANSVDEATRNSWCSQSLGSCTSLCNEDASKNDCDVATLKYDCLCAANNSAPAYQYYDATIPTNICRVLNQRCIASTNDAETQKTCQKNIGDLCGKLAPGSAVTSPSATTSSGPKASGTGKTDATGAPSSSTKSGFAAATAIPVGVAAIAGVLALAL